MREAGGDSRRATRDEALFERIADDYIRKDLVASSRFGRQTLQKLPIGPSEDILEIGCGAGFSVRYLEAEYRTFTGIDYSRNLIDYAVSRNCFPGASFIATDLLEFDPTNQFDVIFMIGVLHHMPDMKSAVEACFDLLKPRGRIAFNEPQRANPIIHLLRKLRSRFDGSYSDEQTEVAARELMEVVSMVGFEHVKSFPQGFLSPPFAEVPLRLPWLMTPLSLGCCSFDTYLERLPPWLLKAFAWNTIIVGQKPL